MFNNSGMKEENQVAFKKSLLKTLSDNLFPKHQNGHNQADQIK